LWAVALQKNQQGCGNPALIYAIDGNSERAQRQAEREEKQEEEL